MLASEKGRRLAAGMPSERMLTESDGPFALACTPISQRLYKDRSNFEVRFRQSVRSVMKGAGAAESYIEGELNEMSQIRIAATLSRRVLGSLNELSFLSRDSWTANRRWIWLCWPQRSPKHLVHCSNTKARNR